MTTPERFRRRQLIEGTVLIIVSLFMVYNAYHDQRIDAEQRACLASTTRGLNEALDARSGIGVRTNDLRDQRIDLLDRRINFFFNLVLASAQNNGEQTEEQMEQFRIKFIAKTLKLQAERDKLKADLQKSKDALAKVPIPEYPKGTCD